MEKTVVIVGTSLARTRATLDDLRQPWLIPIFKRHLGSERKAYTLTGLVFHTAGFKDLWIDWSFYGQYETQITDYGDELKKKVSFGHYLANTFKKIYGIPVEISEVPLTMKFLPEIVNEESIYIPQYE